MTLTFARRATVVLAPVLVIGCPETGSESGGDESESSDTSGDTTDGGCPVGIEGCPCSDAESCYPGLECVDGLCEPEEPVEPCPVGEAGCPCTNAGTCDPGSVCEDGVCTCTPGELGCACLDDGGCSNALDCTDGLCEIPELVSEAANGWGPVTCWGYEDGLSRQATCTAQRGDVVHRVRPACEIAEMLLSEQLLPAPGWPDGGWLGCAAGMDVDAATAPWTDARCFLHDGGGTQCFGRIGHLWINIIPECYLPPSEFQPWGFDLDPEGNTWGCDPSAWPLPPPTANEVDEWRCGGGGLFGPGTCFGRYAGHWTSPEPPCVAEPGPFELGIPYDGWSVFTCL